MPRIVKLDEILGEDIVFDTREEQYVFPADISTALLWKLADLYEKLIPLEAEMEEKKKNGNLSEEEKAVYRALIGETEQALLEGFQERDPSLESLPFGVGGFQLVLATVLVQLGFLADPTNPREGSEKMAIPRSRKKSAPSSSSRSSSKSSASRRTSGAA
jgi:hypothetical protein